MATSRDADPGTPAPLTSGAFWRDFWESSGASLHRGGIDPFRFEGLLRKAIDARGYRTFIDIGGFPGHYVALAQTKLGLDPVLLDTYVDRKVVDALFTEYGVDATRVRLIEGDVFTRDPGTFDVVMSVGFIEHFEDFEKVLGRHVELLAPNGLLFITVPNLRGSLNGFFQRHYDPELLALHNLDAMDPQRLRASALTLGLVDVQVLYHGSFGVWLHHPERYPRWLRFTVRVLNWGGRLIRATRLNAKITSPHVVLFGYRRPNA